VTATAATTASLSAVTAADDNIIVGAGLLHCYFNHK